MRKRVAKVKKPTDAVVLKDHRTWPSSRRLPCGRTLGPPRKAWTWETCVRGLLRFHPLLSTPQGSWCRKRRFAQSAASTPRRPSAFCGSESFACLFVGWVSCETCWCFAMVKKTIFCFFQTLCFFEQASS